MTTEPAADIEVQRSPHQRDQRDQTNGDAGEARRHLGTEADRSVGRGDGEGAGRQGKTGQCDQGEDAAPGQIERGEEVDVALHAMTALLPQQKTLSQEVLVFSWASFPETAKRQMTREHLAFACDQRLKDPDPDLGRAVHIQLLTYVYPMIDGVSRMDNGFRSDLAIRMAAPDRFHCLTTRYEPKLPDLPAQTPA